MLNSKAKNKITITPKVIYNRPYPPDIGLNMQRTNVRLFQNQGTKGMKQSDGS